MNKSTSELQPSLDFSDPKQKRSGLRNNPNHVSRKFPVGYGFRSRLNRIFHCMHQRCLKPSHEAYARYGGHGITICSEWLHDYMGFLKWALANGYSEDLTLDRKDNDKGYSPDNCQWQTKKEQSNNRRDNHLLTAWAETKTITEWTRDPRCTVQKGCLRLRIVNGWSSEEAISRPSKLQHLIGKMRRG